MAKKESMKAVRFCPHWQSPDAASFNSSKAQALQHRTSPAGTSIRFPILAEKHRK